MGRTAKTVTVSLPPELAREVDKLAQRQGRTRSELFRAALRQYIERRERWEELTRYTRARGRDLGVTEDEILDSVMQERRKRRKWGPKPTGP